MKKIIVLLLIIAIASGCTSTNSKVQNPSIGTSDAANAQGGNNKSETIDNQASQTLPASGEGERDSDSDWFTGAIGNANIHARLYFSGYSITGEYYYDKYRTSIGLKGNLSKDIKDIPTITLIEDTDEEGQIIGLLRNENYIQGLWKSGEEIHPMYLIKESVTVAAPKQPGENTLRFAGHWTGRESGFFSGSEIGITALFDDLLYYEMFAHNGTHTGVLSSFIIVNGNIAETIFEDKTDYKAPENVVFSFSIKDNCLILDSNDYDYYCGMGVGFDSTYTKEVIDITMPSALDVGIVSTEEQERLFRKIVGDAYKDFIVYTQYVDYSSVVLDEQEVWAGNSWLRGEPYYCSYILSDEFIYAANYVHDHIDYYTNDHRYATKLPKPIADWANWVGDSTVRIEYHYLNTKQ